MSLPIDANVNELIGGLKNAIERGQNITDAKQTFLNAGYNAQEVDLAIQGLNQVIPIKIISPSSKKESGKLQVKPLPSMNTLIPQKTQGRKRSLFSFLRRKPKEKIKNIPPITMIKPKVEPIKPKVESLKETKKEKPKKEKKEKHIVDEKPKEKKAKKELSALKIVVILLLVALILVGSAILGLFWDRWFG